MECYMFGDLDWPLETSCALAIAEFLVLLHGHTHFSSIYENGVDNLNAWSTILCWNLIQCMTQATTFAKLRHARRAAHHIWSCDVLYNMLWKSTILKTQHIDSIEHQWPICEMCRDIFCRKSSHKRCDQDTVSFLKPPPKTKHKIN